MNTENIDIAQLRKAWQEMGKALGVNPAIEQPEILNKMSTALDKLRNRYRFMGIFTLCVTAMMFPLLLTAEYIAEEYRWAVAFTFVIFLAGMACVDLWLWSGIQRINPLTMSVSEVAHLALHYRKCHIRTVMIALPLALCWMVFIAFATLQSYIQVFWGMACGGAIGLAIGSIILRKFMSDYKKLAE